MKKIETKYIVMGLTAVGLLMWAVSWYVQYQQSDYAVATQLLIAQQETTLTSLAEIIDRDGADAVVSALIYDCELESRKRFDTLLSSLDTLTGAELAEVDVLFEACGDFYAQRKAVMVARLQREFEVYSDYVALLTIIDATADISEYPVEKWTKLVQLESTRSDLSAELVRIQGEIITALRNGENVYSKEMQSRASEASDIKDTLAYTGIQIDSLREEIIGL